MDENLELHGVALRGEVLLDRSYMGRNQLVIGFPNGFGGSVINDGYGSKQGLYELAVVKLGPDGAGYDITYETPITNDTLGWLTETEVVDTLRRIEQL
jgi:hypothetical protein